MSIKLKQLNIVEQVLCAGLLGSLKNGEKMITSSRLRSAEFSSCGYNQAIYISLIYNSDLVFLDGQIIESTNEIDIDSDYKVSLNITNNDETLKFLISSAQAITRGSYIPDSLLEILRLELIGEVFRFFSDKLDEFGLTLPSYTEPLLIIKNILEEVSIFEACVHIENSLVAFGGSNKFRISQCMHDKKGVLNEICQTIWLDFIDHRNAVKRHDNHTYTKPTKTSTILYILTEYCTSIGPNYWKENLWGKLGLSKINGNTLELISFGPLRL
tara:strand:+ start:79 stop:891 length:813 start_codon:yes stop_codon:yes gene_type:complete